MAARIGVVIIGRNEGERLRASLASVIHIEHRVYVDSGSRDGSQARAEQMGFTVVELSAPPNFTAARARNAGLQKLLELEPQLEFVQMLDGDCELDAAWIDRAVAALESDFQLAAVFGRRRERFPEASVYNRLCDDEWNVPVGEAPSCGGDAMFRVLPLREAVGFTPDLIAGEEPDLCLRMRGKGWRIRRIDAEMTLHDAAILRFSQWWRRAQRAGHAFAELVYRHGRNADPHWKRQVASILFWGGSGCAAGLLALIGLATGAHFALYPSAAVGALFAAQIVRLAFSRWRNSHSLRHAVSWAVLLMVGKIPQLQGLIQFNLRRGNSARFKLIEYKS